MKKKINKSQAELFPDSLNDLLADTPFMVFLSGDGPLVMLRGQAISIGKAMFYSPMPHE